ncbi:MAG: hypothetical protein V1644_02555, partial [Candidatus Micrarchaeota archaeon]
SLQQVETNLADIDENVINAQTTFSQYTLSIERLSDEIDSGTDTQDLFEREYTNVALNAFVIRYNSTLNALATTVKAGETYQRSVINKSNELTQKAVDQNLFKQGLQTAFNIGLDRFSSRTSLETAIQEFQGVNSQQMERTINDSIQSYLYRKNKVDADNAVETVKASAEDLINRKAEVTDCTSITQLEKTWQATLKAQSENKFLQVINNVTLVEHELDKVKTELDKCNTQENNNNASTAQNSEKDNTNIFIAVVLMLIIGYFVWKFTRKPPTQEESTQQNTGKGNLFVP